MWWRAETGGHVVAWAGYFRHEGINELGTIDEDCRHGETMEKPFQGRSSYAVELLAEIAHQLMCGWVGHLGEVELAAFTTIEVNPTFLNVFTMHGTFHGFSIVLYVKYLFYIGLISLFIIEWNKQ